MQRMESESNVFSGNAELFNSFYGGGKMKLEECDDVKLNCEVEELAGNGIHKGCYGTIAKLGEKRSLVLFYNHEDFGDSAWAWVNNDAVDFLQRPSKKHVEEFAEWFKTQDPAKKTRFTETHLREYDSVKVLVEKESYAKFGVHKDMVGTILDPQKIEGRWLVFFPDETGADTIDCPISETDLELVFRP